MELPWVAVIALRLLLPLSILRWPLAGGIVAFLADTFDVVLLDRLGLTDFGTYNTADKALDTYYLALEAWVCHKWKPGAARTTALALFVYRLIGTLLYELTDERLLLLLFPNLFEAFFLTYLLIRRLTGNRVLTTASQVMALNLLLLGPKLLQEYMLHIARYPVYRVIRDLLLAPLGFVN